MNRANHQGLTPQQWARLARDLALWVGTVAALTGAAWLGLQP